MERQRYSLFAIEEAIYTSHTTEPSKKPIVQQNLYRARRQAKEKAGTLWTAQDTLIDTLPHQYDPEHTTAIFDELRTIFHATDKHGRNLHATLHEETILNRAETVLLTDQTSNPTESKPLPVLEKEIAQAYTIRGHHLFAYNELNLLNLLSIGPAILADYQTKAYHTYRENVTKKPKIFTEYAAEYYQDLLGKSDKDLQTYQDRLEQTYYHYAQLEPDEAIDLVSGVPDNICGTCIIGEHCLQKFPPPRPQGMIEHDANTISVFVHEAIRYGEADKISLITNQARFSDAPEEITQGIRTTKATFTSVLRQSQIDWATLSNNPDGYFVRKEALKMIQ